MSDRKRTRPNWSEGANYGKGISSVGSDLLPWGQPVRPLRDCIGAGDSLEWFGSDADDSAAFINSATAAFDDHST
jgi:hypothetical protein